MPQEITDLFLIDTFLAMGLIFIGCYIQSTIGFGLAVVTAPLLYQLSHSYIPGPVIFIALILSIINTFTFNSKLSLRGLGLAVSGRIPGSICGALLLSIIHGAALSAFIGILVLIAVGMSLLPIKIQPTPFRLGLAGFLSGVFGTSASIGGPPMALLFQHQEADSIRANLSAFFLVSCLISLAILVPMGHFGKNELLLSLPLIPAAVIGYLTAMSTIRFIPKHLIRFTSLCICGLSGCMAVATAIIQMLSSK